MDTDIKRTEDPRRRYIAVAVIGISTIVLFFGWLWWDGLTPVERVIVASRTLSIGGCCVTPVITFCLGWVLRAKRSEINRDL